MIEISLNVKCYSTNLLYGRTRQGQVFLKPQAKEFKQYISMMLLGKKFKVDPKKEVVIAEYRFYSKDFWNKQGTVNLKSGDLDNFKKLLQDTVCKSLGFNDALIKVSHDYCFPLEKDQVKILFKKLDYESFNKYCLAIAQ